MRRRAVLSLSAIPLLALLIGCGSDPLAGGGATETGNGITYRILTDSGKIAARAQVVFVRTDTWLQDVQRDGSPQMFGVRADSSGLVHIAKPREGAWAIQAERNGLAGLEHILSADSISDTLRLSKRTLVQGILSGDAIDQVWVVGTAWNAPVGAGGRYLVDKASGRYSIVGSSRDPLLPLGNGVSVAGEWVVKDVVARRDRLVVEDFQDSDLNTTSIHSYIGFGNWYIAKDAGSRVWSTTDSAAPDFHGSLSMQYALKDTAGFVVAGISFISGTGYHKLNLAPMDSICLELRGSGKVGINFQEISVAGSVKSVKHSASVVVGNLDSTWRRTCRKPTDFGASWDALKTNTNDISFSPHGGSKLEIRQIEMWGPTLLDLSIH
jgi:hypothetical protein